MSAHAEQAGGRPSPLGEPTGHEGTVVTQMLIVADIERSARFYRDVLGATVVREGAPTVLRLHNGVLVINVGGGPTPDKPDVTLVPPQDPTVVSGFLNIRVADVAEVHREWSARGAKFLTEPIDNHGAERRCYLRDPDNYLIEVGQTLAPSASGAKQVSSDADTRNVGVDAGGVGIGAGGVDARGVGADPRGVGVGANGVNAGAGAGSRADA
jgi:catechol 2,3-dioxygenase-like lactoylglutathione lyase family enzyme